MNWQTAELITETYTKDKNGFDDVTKTAKSIFAKIESISGREFFNAAQSNIKPEFKLIVQADEYGGEKIINLSGQRYSVYRTYQANENTIELYVERKVGTS